MVNPPVVMLEGVAFERLKTVLENISTLSYLSLFFKLFFCISDGFYIRDSFSLA